jgi:hypothetical protein
MDMPLKSAVMPEPERQSTSGFGFRPDRADFA